jgi:Protein of unknown function (DUF1572)
MLPFYETLAERFHDLHEEIRNDLSALPPEALDWIPGHEMNSISVIITHLTGAERFLIGDVVMQDPSNRNRDAEFLVKGLTKDDLNRRIDETEAYIRTVFEKLAMEDLSTTRLHPRHGDQVKVAWALLHALDHIATHLGHINITTQLWHQRSAGR